MLRADEIILQLSESLIYRDYEKAFNDATALPLALSPKVLWQPALHGKKNESEFCSLMAKKSRSCAACLEVQEALRQGEPEQARTVTCFAGLCDTAVPLTVGGDLIGYLQTGQVALRRPSRAGFSRLSRQLLDWGAQVDLGKLEDAYFHARVLSRKQYEAMVRLLEIFARHLSAVANECLVQNERHDPPLVHRARKIIAEKAGGELTLSQLAHALNVSTFYFCKMFKKATGLTFTEYVTRTRIEKAKKLLLDPRVRISEAAYDSGFTSVTHFNRSFRRVAGESPTQYRKALAHFSPGEPGRK
ncbi:MAG TPA: helix-turn-helix domain-containing protein [Candidatus Methylacidiphilales bacterium]|jgi:AraC-like DNA-binding protein|nr:helix-turn-helix domain-containing protein [Candidatus Methylacidiphilales bacterium]